MIKRDIEPEIYNWIENKEILAIRGSRQCGKTTLLKKIIKYLKKSDIEEKNIHYIPFVLL
ncbi:MAG: AAA family ATPase [Nanobdellota archaeon]